MGLSIIVVARTPPSGSAPSDVPPSRGQPMLVFSCSKNERWRSQCWIFRAYHLTHGYRISGQRTILPIIFRIRFIWAAISLWLSCVLHVSICSLAISILYNFYLGRVCSFEIYIFSLSPVVLTENVTIKRFFHSRRR